MVMHVWHVKVDMKRIILRKLLEKFLKKREDKNAVYIKLNGKKVYLKDIYTAEGLINIETEENNG